MSDMEQSDLVAPEVPAVEVAPATEPVAPEQPAVEVPTEALAPEPEAVPAVEVPVLPVLALQPSSANETQQPESDPNVVELAPPVLEDAVRVLLVYVKAHRTAGDADLEAAVADVEASLAAQA